VRYCGRCILPDTRPGLEIGPDGVCSACNAHVHRTEEVDWDARGRRFDQLVAEVRALDRPYDCVIPVSGGKDSHWQTVTCLEAGLHPLCVSWRSPARTALGQANLDNLIGLGVDHIDYRVNPSVERVFLLRSLERFGTPAVPMHLAIFNIPGSIAVRHDVPLIVWGEDSAVEYVGEKEDSFELDAEWVRLYGAAHGTTAADWVSDDLRAQALAPYFGPGADLLEASGIRGVFLGWFFRWDPSQAARLAVEHGFQAAARARTGYYGYADIDDDFISIHHWIKWLKFGFTRTYDNLSLEIRNGRLTREQAIEIVQRRGDETPHEDIDRFCSYVGISRGRFFDIVESFRNHEVWERRGGGWVIDDFLVPGWDWKAPAAAVA
jgi:N-acetyl sugar amidotransferase